MIKRKQTRFGSGLKSCSAKVAASSAMLAASLMTSNAAIIYSNTAITAFGGAAQGVDFDGGGAELQITTTIVKGGGDNELSWGSFGSSFSFVTGGKASPTPTDMTIGTTIDGSGFYSANDANDFFGTNPYVGFTFDDGGGFRNGWLKVDTSSNNMSITEWAYEDTGASIKVGQTAVPEPSSTLLVLASGMLGLTLRRRKK